MKLALNSLGLLGLVISVWWFYAMSSHPRSVAQNPPQNKSQRDPLNEPSNNFQNKDRGEAIIRFDSPAEAERWRVVNDNVMGGMSQSTFIVTPASTGVFQGTTSLENNGGFSSVRRASADFDFAGTEAISVRVKGDGRRYQLRLKTDDSNRSLSYRAEFDTRPDEWVTLRFAFEDFEPVFRGRTIANEPAIVPADIQQIGFLIADKKSGEFMLETDWIQVE